MPSNYPLHPSPSPYPYRFLHPNRAARKRRALRAKKKAAAHQRRWRTSSGSRPAATAHGQWRQAGAFPPLFPPPFSSPLRSLPSLAHICVVDLRRPLLQTRTAVHGGAQRRRTSVIDGCARRDEASSHPTPTPLGIPSSNPRNSTKSVLQCA